MGPFAKEETSKEKGVDTAGIEVGMLVFKNKKIVHVAIDV